ncbi:DUF4089 domain-containing protein [Acaryochloris sp. IP29b_bin.137]|uniref:DUF4089 domain-containing protein n=1 Tax=Acaryochloris sp. IP29b_bin.137 TaxID=2969217 RepID=UPI00261D44C1|nr:DUF4089 domain-containing protein [Acaryochloris sp. IP29b_bin.137]
MSKPSASPSNDSDAFTSAYVTEMAKLLELSIPLDQLPGVVESFEQIHRIAQPVLNFPLPDTLEAAPQFEP